MFTIILSLIIAIAGFVGLYFVSQTRNDFSKSERVTTYPFRKVAPLTFILPLLVFLFESFTIVPAGHVGVQVTMGTVNPVPLTEGVHFVNPTPLS